MVEDATEDLALYSVSLVKSGDGWTYELKAPEGSERSPRVFETRRMAFREGATKMMKRLPNEDADVLREKV